MNAESGSADTRAQVVALARELGFDLCRFARAEMPWHAAEFRDWLDRGDAGEMNYLARNSERRCDPREMPAKRLQPEPVSLQQSGELRGMLGAMTIIN